MMPKEFKDSKHVNSDAKLMHLPSIIHLDAAANTKMLRSMCVADENWTGWQTELSDVALGWMDFWT